MGGKSLFDVYDLVVPGRLYTVYLPNIYRETNLRLSLVSKNECSGKINPASTALKANLMAGSPPLLVSC